MSMPALRLTFHTMIIYMYEVATTIQNYSTVRDLTDLLGCAQSDLDSELTRFGYSLAGQTKGGGEGLPVQQQKLHIAKLT